MDNNTFVEAQIRAAFYPKFENEKSDEETRKQMIEMVSRGFATMEVTLKHSGSLFMYAGHRGAYSKNSFGNIYTAVGVFVLDRMFREAWGKEAPQMQAEFNDYLQENRINVSMELVTAELGDHGQRPKDDYAVVTAVTELGHGKPKFYSTPDVIAFCRKWRLSTNHVWLFSRRESATSFFGAYDALCEVGTATQVCKALDRIADISVPGSKDHLKVQGEILEGLVARIVSYQSSDQMKEVLRSLSQAPLHGVDSDLGPSLREICAANRSDEKQKIKALLENVRSSMCPDHSDWFGNSSLDAQSRNSDKSLVTYFLESHPTDYATKKLQEMIRLMKQRHLHASFKCYLNYQNVDSLSYKMVIHVRRDSIFRRYQHEMKKNQGLWPLYRGFFIHINLFKANNMKGAELSKDSNTSLEIIDGAVDSSSSAQDGLAGEDSSLMVKLKFLNYKVGRSFQAEEANRRVLQPSILSTLVSPASIKTGIPGCAKSALCKEILEMPGGLGDNRPLHSLTGDLIGGRYWQKVADKRKEEPFRITLADKNAPNEKVWRQIEDICRTTKAAAVPVISDSEGTDTNPFSLEALAVFMFRVLQRVNHDGHLDGALWNAGYVLLKFYNLYEGKSRSEFESKLSERFGLLVKMPLLKPDRGPLPGDVKSILDEGLSLFTHGRAELSQGSYVREWAQWEKRLREILFGNDDYLKSIQVPFEVAVKEVVEQLKEVAKGDTKTPDTVKRSFGNIIFAAVTLSQADILGLVRKVAEKDTDVNNFLNGIKLEDNLMKVHVTLAHKRAHGVAAVASYSVYRNKKLPVSFNAFFYNDKMAALGAQLGMVNGEAIVSKNDFPHCTLWTVGGVAPKEAHTLPQLVSEGKAKQVLIDSPITISGVVNFY
uniref:Uncharacterized protein n=1 Tax=Avena sativa TaxID=4498 RepID=A0ACD5XYW8_AVESA